MIKELKWKALVIGSILTVILSQLLYYNGLFWGQLIGTLFATMIVGYMVGRELRVSVLNGFFVGIIYAIICITTTFIYGYALTFGAILIFTFIIIFGIIGAVIGSLMRGKES